MLRPRPLSLTALRRGGFTLIELLVVLAIIGILAGILLPVLMAARQKARYNTAKAAMRAISMAVEKYREDFGRYPPDGPPAAPKPANASACGTPGAPSPNGAINLAFFLCQRFTVGEMHYGPYLEVAANRLVTLGTNKAIISTLGGYYDYRTQVDAAGLIRGYVVVDPGTDKLGGVDWDPSIDSSGISKGYTSITNVATEADNIYSNDKR